MSGEVQTAAAQPGAVGLASSFELLTPAPDGTAALACIEICGNVDALLEQLGVRPVPVGGSAVRRLPGVDTVLVVRWGASAASLMPHGGPLIVAAVLQRLVDAGCKERTLLPDLGEDSWLPEDPAEACRRALPEALATATSPEAIDLLLSQPERWKRWCEAREVAERRSWRADLAVMERAQVLGRLLRPPTVAVVGPANVGKSTLLNALAGASLSVVRDEVGTTRDHVGATVLLGGLAVRWLDTPGLIGLGEPEAALASAEDSVHSDQVAMANAWTDRAFELVAPAILAADVLLLVGDGARPALGNKELLRLAGHRIHSAWAAEWARRAAASPERVLRAALRSDAFASAWEHEVAIGGLGAAGEQARRSAASVGVTRLVGVLREALVPRALLDSPDPWAFWIGEQGKTSRRSMAAKAGPGQ